MIRQYTDFMPTLTPIERHGDMWFKREDLFRVANVHGAKARAFWKIATTGTHKGLVAAGSRTSHRVNLVAQIAKRLNLPCRLHIPFGELSEELKMAEEVGAEIIRHKPGYNSVIIKRCKEDAKQSGWTEMPFMDVPLAVDQVSEQVKNIPTGVRRIITTVGSGMALAGILWGLKKQKLDLPVFGLYVGFDPSDRIGKYAPLGWRGSNVVLRHSGSKYEEIAPANQWVYRGVPLDPFYEAKLVPHIRPGDLFWIVAIRQSYKSFVE
jgi:1-aminocyclopropane-1-carboxylate deaminase/D-cysteine desulfhydrase-like pyridoxal-dependent ACC family enzyme